MRQSVQDTLGHENTQAQQSGLSQEQFANMINEIENLKPYAAVLKKIRPNFSMELLKRVIFGQSVEDFEKMFQIGWGKVRRLLA